MHPALSLFRNTFASMFTNVLTRLGNMLLFIFVVQQLGVDAAGVYTTGISYFFISSRFAFWGLDHLLTREVARRPEQAARFLTNFLLLRLLLAIAAIAIFALAVVAAPYSSSTTLVILILLLSVLPENISNLCWAAFAAFEEFHLSSLGSLVGGLFKVGAGVAVLLLGYGVATVAVVFLLSNLLTMVVNVWLVRIRYLPQWQRPDVSFIRRQLRIAFPFVFIGMFFILDNRLDNVLLSLLNSEAAVGVYAAATAVILALGMLPEGYRVAVLPILARYQRENPAALATLYERSLKYLLMLALPLSVAAALTAGSLIPLIYRQELPEAVPALQIMSTGLVFLFLNILNNRLLIVYDRQDLIARFLGFTVLQNVVINLLLAPQFGAVGAAIARVASLFALFCLTTLAVRRILPQISGWRYLWRPALAVAAMGWVVWQLAPAGLLMQTLAGSAVYGLGLLVLGAFSAAERERLQLFIRQALSTTKTI